MGRKRVLSLFSGCGGMDLGFHGDFTVHRKSVPERLLAECLATDKEEWLRLPRNDFEIVFANDILREAKAAYVPYFAARGSDHVFRSESIVDLVKDAEAGKSVFPRADIVIGGFPCQDFSLAGKRLGLSSQKSHRGILEPDTPSVESRGQLYIWMKKVIEAVKPKVFVAENVKGLVSLGDVKRIIESDFRNVDQGYVVLDARVLHAANYGVPQTRERVIFLGFSKRYLSELGLQKLLDGSIDPYPPKTHDLPDHLGVGLRPAVVLADVFADLQEPDNTDDVHQKAHSRAKYYGKHVQGQTEVKLHALGPTIRAEHHGNIEFRRLAAENGGRYASELKQGLQQRRLTIRECARIQTFPDDYQFLREKSELGVEMGLTSSNAYKVIGNAVPPLLGFQIARRLQDCWTEVFGAGQ